METILEPVVSGPARHESCNAIIAKRIYLVGKKSTELRSMKKYSLGLPVVVVYLRIIIHVGEMFSCFPSLVLSLHCQLSFFLVFFQHVKKARKTFS